MKSFIIVSMLCLAFGLSVNAQDAQYVGTWIFHNEATFNEDDGSCSHATWDHYIRIDVEDNSFFVRLKLVGKDVEGRDFQTRREGENVVINPDGSISFDDYLSKKEYDNEDHLYWTVWYHYDAKYEGGRLKVSEKLMGEGRNSNGYLVKDEKDLHHVERRTYYNEKDNW